MHRPDDLVPRPVTLVDELLATAHALTCEAEVRYRSLAEHMRLCGDMGLTHRFA